MVKILVHLNDLLFYLLQSYKTFSPFTIKKSITSKICRKLMFIYLLKIEVNDNESSYLSSKLSVTVDPARAAEYVQWSFSPEGVVSRNAEGKLVAMWPDTTICIASIVAENAIYKEGDTPETAKDVEEPTFISIDDSGINIRGTKPYIYINNK